MYIEKKRVGLSSEKPTRKTAQDMEGMPGESDVVPEKIEYSSRRTEPKGLALQNAVQTWSKMNSTLQLQ